MGRTSARSRRAQARQRARGRRPAQIPGTEILQVAIARCLRLSRQPAAHLNRQAAQEIVARAVQGLAVEQSGKVAAARAGFYLPISSRNFSTSSDAMHPDPAAVIA